MIEALNLIPSRNFPDGFYVLFFCCCALIGGLLARNHPALLIIIPVIQNLVVNLAQAEYAIYAFQRYGSFKPNRFR